MNVCPVCTLPNRTPRLSKYCRVCRGPSKMPYGKYKGMWYREVLQEHQYFCKWLVKNYNTYRVRKYQSTTSFVRWLRKHPYDAKWCMRPFEYRWTGNELKSK